MQSPKFELLSPAGDLEKLTTAIYYGANSVYLAGAEFGMRKASKNFTLDQLRYGVEFAHKRGVRVFVTLNTVPSNEEVDRLPAFIKKIKEVGVDAVIVTDIGVMFEALSQGLEVHISTQVSTSNYKAAQKWYELGAKRVVLARELSFEEIKFIRENTSKELELEIFVHGAMCISYSGRCYLSNYMTGRDANRGNCAQSCRWKYALMEEKRPGEYFPVYEDWQNNAHILNSKDICMIEHMKELMEIGIDSFKIEGRVKSSYYVACVTNVYRQAMDEYISNPTDYKFNNAWYDELIKVSHREYDTGFLFGRKPLEFYPHSGYTREWDIVASYVGYNQEKKRAIFSLKNKLLQGDELEILSPKKEPFSYIAQEIFDSFSQVIEVANVTQMIFEMPFEMPLAEGSLLRKEKYFPPQ